MNNNTLNNEEMEKLKRDLIFKHLNSVEELQDWVYLYFDLYFPKGVVSPNSSHGPADAMWRIYQLMKTGESSEVPEVVMKASRDSGKTLAAAVLEVLCMLHFRISICVMAAITSQSAKQIQYIELFLRKIDSYLTHHGWKKNSNNKRMIEWITDDGQNVYIKVVVATMAGANSEHVPMLFCVDGKTEIPCKIRNKNPNNKHTHKNNTASKIYSKIKKNEEVEIVSFNHETLSLEFKKCINASKSIKDIYRVTLENDQTIDMSMDQPIYIKNEGYVPLNEVEVGNKVLYFQKSKTYKKLNINFDKKDIEELDLRYNYIDFKSELEDVILGSLLGDAGCYRRKGNNAYIKETHGMKQKEYLEWKKSFFDKNNIKSNIKYYGRSGYTGESQPCLTTGNNDCFNQYVDFKKNFHKTGVLENISPLMLAIWYQDDGCTNNFFKIATHSFSKEQNEYLSDLLNRKFGFSTFIYKEKKKDGRSWHTIMGGHGDLQRLKKICGDLFHPSMMYKLLKININRNNSTDFLKIKSIGFLKTGFVYDFTIEDNHNFIGNKILLKNCDEIDLFADPRSLEEAKLIPSSFKGLQPLMIYLSTYKFSGGLMSKTLESVKKAGGEIFSWNIIDVTERITREEARANEPKVTRYITTELPMSNISPEQWLSLSEREQSKYEQFESYVGISEHPLLPVMRNYLVDRPRDDKGSFLKKPIATLNLFKKLSIEMSNAQLLCNRPSTSNLVYPRFDPILNSLSVKDAWNIAVGSPNDSANHDQLREFIIKMGAKIIGGMDFGFSDYHSTVIFALMPGGTCWLVDSFIENKLEPEDVVKHAVEFQNKWNVEIWWTDQNRPDIVATMRKKGLKVPNFTKSILEGIGAVQSRIVDSMGTRRLMVLDIPENKIVFEAFANYKWALDGKGDIIDGKPHHDREGYSDILDSIKYPIFNLFSKSGKIIFTSTYDSPKPISQSQDLQKLGEEANAQIMKDKINSLIPEEERNKVDASKPKTGRKMLWM